VKTRGSTTDFDDVFRQSLDRIVRSVWLVVGDWEVARELTQDAFVEALRRWRTVRDYDDPGAWVRRVALHKAIDERRRRRPPPPVAPVPPPLQLELRLDVAKALLHLTEKQRAIVVLYYLHDLSVKDVAVELGMSDGTVKTHLHRARSILAPLLAEEDEDEP
jgi:RNA polymerase sigma-70 factor (ECF subfamily)